MKKLFKVLLVLVGLLALGLLLLVVFLDKAVVAAVEKGGSYAMGVETKLGDAHVGLGTFGLEQLSIANPPGFSSPTFVTLGSARFEVEPGTFLSERIVAPLLEVHDVSIDLDKNTSGSNYGVILKNLERLTPKEGEKGEEEPGGPSKAIQIKKLRIYNVKATVQLLAIGGDITRTSVRIPEIRVDDFESDEMTSAQLTSFLVRTVLGSVVESGKGILPDDLMKDLGGQLKNLGHVALVVTGGVLEGVGDVGGAAKEIGEAAGHELGKLKDLIKKKE